MNTFGCCEHSCPSDCVNSSFISLEHAPRSVAGSGGHSVDSVWTGLFAPRKAERPGGVGILQAADSTSLVSGLGERIKELKLEGTQH